MTDTSIPQKQCRVCHQLLPISDFQKGYAKCRRCYSIHTGHQPRGKVVRDGHKKCSSCKQWFPATTEYFYLDKRYGTCRSKCKTCMNGASLQYNRNHVGVVRRIHRKWRRAHPDKVLKQLQKTRTKHPLYMTAATQRRAARKRGLPDTLTKTEWATCLDYWGNCCAVCGAQNGLWIRICADHWIPLSNPRCPGTVQTNIVPMCMSCNSSKSNMLPDVWAYRELGKRKAKQLLSKVEAYFSWVNSEHDHPPSPCRAGA